MYDTATDTIGEFMGVDVVPIESKFQGSFEPPGGRIRLWN